MAYMISQIAAGIYSELSNEEKEVNSANKITQELNKVLMSSGDLVECALGKIETKQGEAHGIKGEYRENGDERYWQPLYSEAGCSYVLKLFQDNRSSILNPPIKKPKKTASNPQRQASLSAPQKQDKGTRKNQCAQTGVKEKRDEKLESTPARPKGFDRWGRNLETKTMYDPEGYDKDGYNRFGLTREGIDRNGFYRSGIHSVTGKIYDPDGYDREGYDSEGYSRSGFDRLGYTRDGLSRNILLGGYDSGDNWSPGLPSKRNRK